MKPGTLWIRNCCCLDPMHAVSFETKDLRITDGRFQPDTSDFGTNVEMLDAGKRIVIPGGILPSFNVPIPSTLGISFDPVASARALLCAGFTTIIVDGITPFIALDVHQQIQRIPFVNKIPIIDVGNFQLLLGFLKSGVGNYAAGVSGSLLARFKGFGISCMGPGNTLTWSVTQPVMTRSINDPLPFLNITIEKIIRELVESHNKGSFNPAIIVQTGIEGMPGSRKQLDDLVASLHEQQKGREPLPAIALKHLSRYALDPDHEKGNIAGNVSAVLATMENATSVAGLLDLPPLEFSGTTFIDFASSPLHDSRYLLARGIMEGELAVTAYRIDDREQRDLATRFWLAGMKLTLELPARLKERVAFSLMPELVTDSSRLVDNMACLLSDTYRHSQQMKYLDGAARTMAHELLDEKTISLQDLVRMTRVVPARLFGLEKMIGGMGGGQLGDAIILNAWEGDLDALRDKPGTLRGMLDAPHAVIKGGTIVFKDGIMAAHAKGFTFLHDMPADPSISTSIEQNIDKQFLKYYSTNIDAKTVPASLVEPFIKD